MGKIYNRKFLFVIATVITCIVIAVIIRLCFAQRIVRMSISPTELYVGEKIYYSDSTRNADTWLWEFGDGNTSSQRTGNYTFENAGKYMVRLTVDNSLEQRLLVTVRQKSNDYGSDGLVKMKAPSTALQGEIVSFRGYGPSKEWRWQFGESGIVDSREQNFFF